MNQVKNHQGNADATLQNPHVPFWSILFKVIWESQHRITPYNGLSKFTAEGNYLSP